MKMRKLILATLAMLCIVASSSALFTACDQPSENGSESSTVLDGSQSSSSDGSIEGNYPAYTLSDAANPLIEEVYSSINPAEWEEYFLYSNGTISGLTKAIDWNIKTLVVPSKIKGEEVKAVRMTNVIARLPNLERVVFCEGITHIDYWGIQSQIKEIFLPNSFTMLNEAYSTSNSNVENVFVRADNPVFKSIDGNLYSKDGKTLVLYASKKTSASFEIPLGVTTISDGVGALASNLVNVSIPDTVTSVGYIAFQTSNLQYTVKDGLCYLGNKNNPYLYFCGAEEGVTALNIHENCKLIGSNTLPDNLTSVTIPNGVVFIHELAARGTGETALQFTEDKGLYYLGNEENPYLYLYRWDAQEINVHPDCKFLSLGLFKHKTDITSVRLPDSVTEIPDFTFMNCYNLQAIELGSNVQRIGEFAFKNCFRLQSIRLPASVTEIGTNAFAWWVDIPPGQDYDIASALAKSSLQKIEVDAENPVYTSIDGNLYSKDGKTLLLYAAGKTDSSFTIIPDGTVKIAAGAFDWRYCLTSIQIPVSVIEIEGSLCGQEFKEVYYEGSVEEWNKISFSGTLVASEGKVYYNGESPTEIVLPEGTTSVAAAAFSGQSSITSIVIPDSVTEIGAFAFEGCTGLTEITLPDGVTQIGEGAFYGCINLTSVNIPEGVTRIEDYAFADCTGLTEIVLPDSVTAIGERAFVRCTNLAAVNIPEGVTHIGASAFEGCTSLTAVNIPSSVTRIERYAFNCCAALTELIIPDSVTELWCDFSGCSALKAIVFPKNAKIYSFTFTDCASLTKIDIPECVRQIEEGAFDGCSVLTEMTLPNSIQYIYRTRYSFDFSALKATEENGGLYIGNATNPYLCLVKVTGEGAFQLNDNCKLLVSGISCSKVTEFIVSENNTAFKAIDGNLYSKDGKTLIMQVKMSGEGYFILPEGVEVIADYALNMKQGIVVLPKTILSIYEQNIPEANVIKNSFKFFLMGAVPGSENSLLSMSRYNYTYSETKPETIEGNRRYWHYNSDGEPVVWTN